MTSNVTLNDGTLQRSDNPPDTQRALNLPYMYGMLGEGDEGVVLVGSPTRNRTTPSKDNHQQSLVC